MNSRTLLWPLLALGLVFSGCSGSGSGGSGGAPAPAPAPNAGPLPQLPQKQVDVTMPTVNGSTRPATCSTLQAEIDAAAARDVNLTHQIILATGATCTGPYVLPAHVGTGWILVTGPNGPDGGVVASGTRVSLADAASMPTVKYGDNGAGHVGAFSAASNARRYRIIGISMIQDSALVPNLSFVSMGYNNANALNTGYIILDRIVIQDTDSTHYSHQGVYMNASLGHTAIVDSYITGIKECCTDVQAILITANAGPVLIRNNFLRASSENINFGGGGTPNTEQIPQDVTVQRNTFDKDPTWVSGGVIQMKSLFETKCVLRLLVEGNDFSTCHRTVGGMPSA